MAYKPKLKFQANANFPLALGNESLIRKRTDNNKYENFANKTDLTNYIDALYNPPDSDTYLQAICGCGIEYNYATKESVPDTDIVCNCGRKILIYGN